MKELLKNKKAVALIKLIFWLVFAGLLFAVLVHEKNKVEQYQKDYESRYNFTVDFNYLKTSLLNNDFKYLYIIIDGDILSYEGSRVNGKYMGVSKADDQKKEYKDLVALNKKYPFLSIQHLLTYFDKDFNSTNNTFLYEKDKLYVKIRVSIDNIVNIEVNDNGIIYQLEISDIKGFDVKGSE